MRCSHGHRPLGDLETATTAGTLLGAPLTFPIVLAPVAYPRLAHPDGELATVPGASAAPAWMTVSTLASVRMEEIAKAAQTVLWFQLDMQERREATLRLVRRAEAAGYRALMVTVDAAVNGVRNEEQRAGFNLARHVRPANLDGSRVRARVPCSRACSPMRRNGRTSPGSGAETRLPLLLKGIVHPLDAERAIAAGADGIVVSNHGGRTLGTLPASIAALEVVAQRVRGRVPPLVDGGIRRGTDVLKCLALGASAVMVGQPIVHALAVAGAVGVVHLIRIVRAEFEARRR